MKYVLGDPSRHPAAWLSLVAGLVVLTFAFLLGGDVGTGSVGLLMGLALTALGTAELLPVRLRPASVVLRMTGLLLAAATLVVAALGIPSG